MKRNVILYLRDILGAIESIEEFVKDMTFEEFRLDDKTSSAVIRKFEIIGEAARNIPKSIRQNILIFHGRNWLVFGINSFIFTLELNMRSFGIL